jgi:protein involved in polysaccharide export with SLBB domain
VFRQFSESENNDFLVRGGKPDVIRKEKSGLFWNMNKALALLAIVLLLGSQGSVRGESAADAGEAAKVDAGRPESPASDDEYLVSPQDVLEITVVGEKELSGLFEVSRKQDGTIKYPYLEYVPVTGKTVKQVEELLTNLLKDGWLVNPQVNVRVAIYSEKFVYVGGQVNRPGKLSFSGRNEMTLYRAIITAGGFTRIAQRKKVVLMTTDEDGKPKRLVVDVSDVIEKPELDPPIKANDRISVPERFL